MNTPMVSCRMQVSEMQRKLAQKATTDKTHRFTHLYDLLSWKPLMDWAFDTLMTNRGSRTAGLDGMDKRTAIKNKQTLLADLRAALKSKTYQPQPVRRVYIPKANGKQRPLGIPTLTDRWVQMMVKAILDPIYESDFLPSSHGFRPQRSCHSAMAYLHQRTAPKPTKMYWVIEGDIQGCFDHIQHQTLIQLLRKRIQDKQLLSVIWRMLKAGVMEGKLFAQTAEGTPQGGVVSPLLANIYLHELDVWMQEQYVGLPPNEKNRRRRHKEGNAFYLRYADDFVVAWNGTKAGACQLKAALKTFLHERLQLDLSEEKTRITYVTDGYDFLGFTVRRVVDVQRGYNELQCYPSKKSVMRIKDKVKAMTRRDSTYASVKDKLQALNCLLGGWANYFRHSVAYNTFDYVDSYAFTRMGIWLRHKTGRRVRAVYRKYYQRRDGYLTWATEDQLLKKTTHTAPIRYLRYAHRPNPYLDSTQTAELPYHLDPFAGKDWDGTMVYGEDWTAKREEALQRDGHRCRLCGSDDRPEVHHLSKHKTNQAHHTLKLITLCASCHRKARNPQSEQSRQLARFYLETGEPDEAKVSCPVREGAS
jgi:RNA-directed DNA polymerase